MQKLIGCILILLSTTAGGFLYGVEQQQYLEKLMYIRHILELIQGEIEYSGAPLFEVFGKTANRVQEPYRSWMLDLQRRVEARGGQSFRGIWEVCTETKLKELHLKEQAYERTFGGGDVSWTDGCEDRQNKYADVS